MPDTPSPADPAAGGRPVIVLVEPEGPRNVGAVARAMANFGLTDLRLVGGPEVAALLHHEECIATAMAGRRLLAAVRVFPSLGDARDGLDALVGASRRPGRRRAPSLAPWDLAAMVHAGRRRIGIVLGNEVTGLATGDLRLCEFLVRIPAVRGAESLNLAQAAMVLIYEWARLSATGGEMARARGARLEDLLDHAARTLGEAGFLATGDPLRAIPKLRRLLSRAATTERELGLLHAILQHWDRQMGSRGRRSPRPRGAGRRAG